MSQAAALPLSQDQLGPPERLHPLYLLTGLGQSVRGAWGLIAGGAVFAAQGRWWIVLLMGLLFAVFSLGSLLVRWLKLEYRVGPHELRIDSGWLSRTSRVIPFDRVTDVDLEQGPLHRIFGLARVKLETGGSAGGKQEEGVLHTISLERAEALREHIRARRGQVVPQVAAEAVGEDSAPIYAMDLRRVLTAGVFNFSLAVIAGLFGLTQTMGDALGFDPFERSFWVGLLAQSAPLRDTIMDHQIIAALAGTMVLLLLGIGTGLIRTLLREYGFRLDRTATGFRRRRGLLTLTDVSIPAKRVQAAILANGPIRRRFGWWELKLQSLAQDGGKGDHVVAPLAREREADSILSSLEWQAAVPSQSWRPVSRAFVTSFIGILLPAALATLVTLPLLGPVGLLWLGGAAMAIVVRWFDWNHTRYAFEKGGLFIETGWWRHRRSMIPQIKIQSIDVSESWWSRIFGICTLRLGVAGGSGFSDHHVPALTRREAVALRAQLLS
ncbi:MAG TPA: PH domain-containing protein [Sphingomicrobium sp.]|nr:PH domain-containing protein [Sphingomicrobium sp.]